MAHILRHAAYCVHQQPEAMHNACCFHMAFLGSLLASTCFHIYACDHCVGAAVVAQVAVSLQVEELEPVC